MIPRFPRASGLSKRTWMSIFISVIVATAFAAPSVASATVLSPAAVSHSARALSEDATQPCDGVNPNEGEIFERCTTTGPDSDWVGTSCSQGMNYEAGTHFNVYAAVDGCFVRVWIHQYTYPKDETEGWSYCFSGGNAYQQTPSQYDDPENIFVSANTSGC